MDTKTLQITGMMCDACVGHVTRGLLALDGVETAEVSLAGSNAAVTYDPAKVQISQMLEAVADEGYEASV